MMLNVASQIICNPNAKTKSKNMYILLNNFSIGYPYTFYSLNYYVYFYLQSLCPMQGSNLRSRSLKFRAVPLS